MHVCCVIFNKVSVSVSTSRNPTAKDRSGSAVDADVSVIASLYIKQQKKSAV